MLLQIEASCMPSNFTAHTGLPASPAYILDKDQGRRIWRFTMPEGGPAVAAPSGNGEGQYRPIEAPRNVVAIVGSAHVRGILREWRGVSHEDYLQRLRDLLPSEFKAA